MDATALEGLLVELREARPAVLAVIEGLRDDLRLNLKPKTAADVQALLGECEYRDGFMERLDSALAGARDAVFALLRDGYPDLPKRIIEKPEMEDLVENRRTLEAALGRFEVREVTTDAVVRIGPEVSISGA